MCGVSKGYVCGCGTMYTYIIYTCVYIYIYILYLRQILSVANDAVVIELLLMTTLKAFRVRLAFNSELYEAGLGRTNYRELS